MPEFVRGPISKNRRGVSLVLAAVSLTALCGVGAIAVDLGMLLRARADAQRAAEAGALAGASAFLDFNPNSSNIVIEAKRGPSSSPSPTRC